MNNLAKLGLMLSVITLISCREMPWQGWVYPNRQDLSKSIELGSFESLEACRNSAKSVIENLVEAHQLTKEIDSQHEIPATDWECGFKCESDDGFNICERTER